ncbi:MAG: hypothetical protein RR565_09205 [Erysipelothrix sp.]
MKKIIITCLSLFLVSNLYTIVQYSQMKEHRNYFFLSEIVSPYRDSFVISEDLTEHSIQEIIKQADQYNVELFQVVYDEENDRIVQYIYTQNQETLDKLSIHPKITPNDFMNIAEPIEKCSSPYRMDINVIGKNLSILPWSETNTDTIGFATIVTGSSENDVVLFLENIPVSYVKSQNHESLSISPLFEFITTLQFFTEPSALILMTSMLISMMLYTLKNHRKYMVQKLNGLSIRTIYYKTLKEVIQITFVCYVLVLSTGYMVLTKSIDLFNRSYITFSIYQLIWMLLIESLWLFICVQIFARENYIYRERNIKKRIVLILIPILILKSFAISFLYDKMEVYKFSNEMLASAEETENYYKKNPVEIFQITPVGNMSSQVLFENSNLLYHQLNNDGIVVMADMQDENYPIIKINEKFLEMNGISALGEDEYFLASETMYHEFRRVLDTSPIYCNSREHNCEKARLVNLKKVELSNLFTVPEHVNFSNITRDYVLHVSNNFMNFQDFQIINVYEDNEQNHITRNGNISENHCKFESRARVAERGKLEIKSYRKIKLSELLIAVLMNITLIGIAILITVPMIERKIAVQGLSGVSSWKQIKHILLGIISVSCVAIVLTHLLRKGSHETALFMFIIPLLDMMVHVVAVYILDLKIIKIIKRSKS